MIKEAFLICALSLPSSHHTRPAVVSWQATKAEEDALRDELKKHPEIDDVFITPEGAAERLKPYGWERFPVTIDNHEIWIQRKPKSDQRRMMESA